MTSPQRSTAGGAAETKLRLLAAARSVTCVAGVTGASARKIGNEAGVNQALVFYHFSTVSALVAAASDHFVTEALERVRVKMNRAASTADLLAIAAELRTREGPVGNIAFMTQILAAAPHDKVIAGAAERALSAWTGQIHRALETITADTLVGESIDTAGLASLITAAFVGLELYTESNPAGGRAAQRTLADLTAAIDALLFTRP